MITGMLRWIGIAVLFVWMAIIPIRAQTTPKPKVLLFWSVECPVAESYTHKINQITQIYSAKGVAFEAIFSQDGETARVVESVLRKRGHSWNWRIDPKAKEAYQYGVIRVPTAVVLSPNGELIYFGAIDDAPTQTTSSTNYLTDALDSALAGMPVTITRTKSNGCLISLPDVKETLEGMNYARDVEPILAQHCLPCHQPNGVSPIRLDRYEDVRRWAPMIRDTMATGKMPPYLRTDMVGVVNRPHVIPIEEVEIIRQWVLQGRASGFGEPSFRGRKAPIAPRSAVQLGKVVVPSGGVIYRTEQKFVAPVGSFRGVHLDTLVPSGWRMADLINESGEWLASWTAGQPDPARAFQFKPGEKLSLRLTYRQRVAAYTDRPTLHFYKSETVQPYLEPKLVSLGSGEVMVTNLLSGAELKATWTIQQSGQLYAILPWLNSTYMDSVFWLQTPGREPSRLFDTHQITEAWPVQYQLMRRPRVNPGDVIIWTASVKAAVPNEKAILDRQPPQLEIAIRP
ncbi:MAG: hypothetical protein J0L72_01270 [Armatimonadetes bacterium]|nr:hypothetical protein [Armatimonadota bacterium]